MKALLIAAAFASIASSAEFEVVSIKPADPSSPGPGRMGAYIDTKPTLLSVPNATLKELMEGAYGVEQYQISEGPRWIGSSRFEVRAKSAAPANREELLAALRPVLAARFQLTFHRQTRQVAVYALELAKGGPKFRKSPPGPPRPAMNRLGHNVDMAWFAKYLTRFGSEMPVIDRTGLAGNYDLDLDMEKIMTAAKGDDGPPDNNAIFRATVEAIESQLGLKLTPAKAPLEILVIDHAEPPSQQ